MLGRARARTGERGCCLHTGQLPVSSSSLLIITKCYAADSWSRPTRTVEWTARMPRHGSLVRQWPAAVRYVRSPSNQITPELVSHILTSDRSSALQQAAAVPGCGLGLAVTDVSDLQQNAVATVKCLYPAAIYQTVQRLHWPYKAATFRMSEKANGRLY